MTADAIEGSLALVVGGFGSGKTAFCTTWAYRQRRRYPDRPVYANYDLALPDGEPVRFYRNRDALLDLADCDVILDEAQNWFSAREYRSLGADFLEWLSQLRKYGVRLMAVSQSVSSIDKFIRERVQQLYVVSSYRRLGFFAVTGYDVSDTDRLIADPERRNLHQVLLVNPLILGLYSTRKPTARL